MKHTLKITILLLAMFLITQAIGLYVVDHYSSVKVVNGNVVNVSSPNLPLGLQPPKVEKESDYYNFLSMIIFAFVLAVVIFFVLSKIKIDFLLKVWFFAVIFVALTVSFLSFISKIGIEYALYFSIALALAFAVLKIFWRNIWVHNFTELFIYPGIAAVFVPILNLYTIILLLLIISAYDIWAVWHSGVMQRMAKYQIKKLKVFSGFFVPYFPKEISEKIRKWKKTLTNKQLEKKKIKVNIAILGGGDVVFPIITAGVVLTTGSLTLPFGLKPFLGGLVPAIFVVLGATLGLSYLFFAAKKKRFYPAMPFITAGILVGVLISWLVF